MANEKRFLVLSLKWWQKLQPKWRRGENLTLDRSTTMIFPNPASPTLCHKIYSLSFIWDGREGIAKLSWIHHPITQHLKQVNNLHPEKLLLAESCGIRNFIPNSWGDKFTDAILSLSASVFGGGFNQTRCILTWTAHSQIRRCDRLPRKACGRVVCFSVCLFHLQSSHLVGLDKMPPSHETMIAELAGLRADGHANDLSDKWMWKWKENMSDLDWEIK